MLYARSSFLANMFKKSTKSVERGQAFPAAIQEKLGCGFEEGGDLWQEMAVCMGGSLEEQSLRYYWMLSDEGKRRRKGKKGIVVKRCAR